MAAILWARLRRFWHCLLRFHRGIDVLWDDDFGCGSAVILIGCECGRRFWDAHHGGRS